MIGLVNSREFAEHLDEQTLGRTTVGGSPLLRIARDFKGVPFTKSFDKCTYYLSASEQEKRKMSRLIMILQCEMGREVRYQRPGCRRRYVNI